MKYQVLVGKTTKLFATLDAAMAEFKKHEKSIVWERKDLNKRFVHSNQIVVADSFKGSY